MALYRVFCLCYASAYTGRSTPITAFGGAMILCVHNVDTLKICVKEFGTRKIIFDKMTAMRT